MYREIGEIFRFKEYHSGLPETITKLEVVETKGDKGYKICDGCYFKGFCTSQDRYKDVTGFCSHTFRDDKKDVIFKKVE